MTLTLRKSLIMTAIAAIGIVASAAIHVSSEASQTTTLSRTSINPVSWGIPYKMDQGEVIEGARRVLHFSGQTAIVEDAAAPIGLAVAHAGDIRGQIEMSLANIDAVLEQAGMHRSDIVHLKFFTTDMDGFLQNYDAYASWIGDAGVRPPQSLRVRSGRGTNPERDAPGLRLHTT